MHETGALWVIGPHVNMSSGAKWMCMEKGLGGNMNMMETSLRGMKHVGLTGGEKPTFYNTHELITQECARPHG